MKEKIAKIFENLEEKPLFYIESGSRLWGIASPDSDFDVRGFHIQSKKQYFDFQKHRDIIEIMDGDFDFVSYDVDKMFGLLLKSNPTVFEWIRANIVYFNALPNWEKFQRELIEQYDFKTLFHHYLSLAKGNLEMMKNGKKCNYKTAFYCIRGLLSAELSAQNTLPALLIDELFLQFSTESEVLKIAKNSLEKKKQSTEKQEFEKEEKAYILDSISKHFETLQNISFQTEDNSNKLKDLLFSYSFELKEKFY